ncbi:GspE/PulE family protein [Oceanisphaera arctica]|uniref:MSHA biogenesis protein MshE n=1 Tax=Oceanisphaera arctica TaxID=641510 RepID=A0A2P5TRC8_9GAMM|nr:GspE/PulE family protein [Oceanisphaera arctica]PPL18295.1 MSHA biogenesis protein MshE [Oceanisphaera arctica]GHA12116.1 MSHA biogenesis protein MshE [Oceanisphaera arctica]
MVQRKLTKRLGELLLEHEVITSAQLKTVLEQQRREGGRMGSHLIHMGIMTELELLGFVAEQLDLPLLDLNKVDIDKNAVKLLSEVYARRYRALVIAADDTQTRVVLSDPADLDTQDAISRQLAPRDIQLAVAPHSQLLALYDQLYRRTEDIASLAVQLGEENAPSRSLISSDILDDSEATVAKLLHSLLEDALQIGASDIHIEPEKNLLRLRMRVDGTLQETELKDIGIGPALLSRLKLMAGLDISERRLPQDGRFELNIKQKRIDVRMATMPVQAGEAVVLRLLDQSRSLQGLSGSGMPSALQQAFRRKLASPHGIILVTGPTGSGKTTTLYGALDELNIPERKIITVEDPVEYRLPRINQVQVNSKIGLTFARVLRTSLRQDPDVLLIGEIRDQETAEIAMRGALTGHLVLSTLHTNDAPGTAVRLMDMGVPGYLVASTLKGVLAQRLVRCLCLHCREPYQPELGEQQFLLHLNPAAEQGGYYQGRGCAGCNHTGYKGRVGVFEWLEINRDMADALRERDIEAFNQLVDRQDDFKTLAQSALDLAMSGQTSVQEVLRLAEWLD